jgi:hypothetical protein
MSYDESQRTEVQFADHSRLVSLLEDIGGRLDQVKGTLNQTTGMLNPLDEDWPLEPGQVGVILLPSDPPSTACVLEHPETGHWMLQYPCGGIYIADLTTGQPTF